MTEEIVLRLIIPSIPWNTLANQVIQASINFLAFTGWLILTSISALIYTAKREEKGKKLRLLPTAFALIAMIILALIEKYTPLRLISDSKFDSLEKRAEQLDQIYSPRKEDEVSNSK